jgi:membrane-associated HD superfamily phosphohydrolase
MAKAAVAAAATGVPAVSNVPAIAAWSSFYVNQLTWNLAVLDQNQVVIIGLIMTAFAVGLAKILEVLTQAVLNFWKGYRQIDRESEAGKLHDCEERERQLRDELQGAREQAAFSDNAFKMAQERVKMLLEENKMYFADREEARSELKIAREREQQANIKVHELASRVTDRLVPQTVAVPASPPTETPGV